MYNYQGIINHLLRWKEELDNNPELKKRYYPIILHQYLKIKYGQIRSEMR